MISPLRGCYTRRYNPIMPRTFTLAGLMLGVTVFCVLCGLAVSKSETVQAYILTVASLTPAAIICLAFVSFSRRRKTVLITTLIGAYLGTFWGLPLHGGPAMTIKQAIGIVFVPMAISAAFGAVLFGVATLVIAALDSRFPPDQPP
jgi:hypothetical protein